MLKCTIIINNTATYNFILYYIILDYNSSDGPGSSVGIATDYGLDGPGSNPGGDEIFRTCPDRPWGPPSLLYNGYRVFPGAKRLGRGVDNLPHLVPRLKKEQSYNCTQLRAFVECSRVNFMFYFFKSENYLYICVYISKHVAPSDT